MNARKCQEFDECCPISTGNIWNDRVNKGFNSTFVIGILRTLTNVVGGITGTTFSLWLNGHTHECRASNWTRGWWIALRNWIQTHRHSQITRRNHVEWMFRYIVLVFTINKMNKEASVTYGIELKYTPKIWQISLVSRGFVCVQYWRFNISGNQTDKYIMLSTKL